MAMPRSQHEAATDAVLPEGLPHLHTTQVVDLQANESHLQNPTVHINPTLSEVQQTSDGLEQNKIETPKQTCKQEEKQQSEEEQQQDKEQQFNSNQKNTHLHLHTDVRYDKEVLTLDCKDKGQEGYDTFKTGNNKNITIQKRKDSKCELENRIVGNSDIYNKKDKLDEFNFKSTNCANEYKVNCDSNNNLKDKDASTSVTVNNRKVSDIVILINDEHCDGKETNSIIKNNILKKPEIPIYRIDRLQPPLNKVASVPTLNISSPLNKVASEPNLRLSSHFTNYKNSYLQGRGISEFNLKKDISELYLERDSPRESIDKKKQAKKKTKEVKMLKPNCCIFCGEDPQMEGTGLGQLITFCQCKASAHNGCLLGYVTFPSSSYDRCCVCKSKLQYMVIDKDTPMQIKYGIVLALISVAYLSLVLLSMHFTQELIPMGDINEFLYLLLIGNVGFIPPAVIVFIISCLLNFLRPQPKLGETEGKRLISGGFPTWFGCNTEDCDDKSCGGDACGFILAAFCLLSVMVVLISASIYIVYNVYLYYISFKLKSRKSIRFSCERKNKNKCTV